MENEKIETIQVASANGNWTNDYRAVCIDRENDRYQIVDHIYGWTGIKLVARISSRNGKKIYGFIN